MFAARRVLSLISVVVTTTALAVLAPGAAQAASALSPYDVRRVGTSTTYTATAANGSVISGSLKSVVQSAAVNLTSGGGGTVRFFAGTYDLGSTWWEFEDLLGVTFEGAGMGQTVIVNNTSATTDTEPFDMTGSDSITIRDLTVDARGALRTTSDAIDFDGGDNILIERVEVVGARARGIVFDGKGSGDLSHADDNVVRDCIVRGVPGAGIELLAVERTTIQGCTITNTGSYGIRVTKSSTSASQPNKPSQDNVLRGNRIDQAGSDGIFVNSSHRTLIEGNVITNSSDDTSSRDGIRINSSDSKPCDDTIVRTNTATDTQTTKTQAWGLNITSSLCHRTVVGADNDFTGNKTGTVKDQGTGTTVGTGNVRPTVGAGPNRTTSVSATAALDGTVGDDGPAPLVTTWSQQSGPAPVTFGSASSVDTTVGASTPGTYELRLTATDGAGLSAFDEMVLTVLPDGVNTADLRVASGLDDAEERAGGAVSRSSTDLELVTDASAQVVGIRFSGVPVPAGAAVTAAWVQFTADEAGSAPTSLDVRLQLSPNAPAITGNSLNLSSRLSVATAPVGWAPAVWPSVGASGPDQRTPSLAASLQQIVDLNGWSAGNAVVVLVTGSGKRTAVAYDGNPAGAAVLHVEYTLP